MKRWLILFLLPLVACQMDYAPKPLAYNRIDIPKNIDHSAVDTPKHWKSYLYSGAQVKNDRKNDRWNTIIFPKYNAELFLTYFPISDTLGLETLLEEMHQLSFDHQQKANAIEVNPKELNNGNLILEYKIKGDAATAYQFCITDSSRNYLRGALYFRNTPNYDSTLPVLSFIEQELSLFMDSLEWKN
jgi:gliding motility-associated lipoprotein GldD